MVSAVDVTASSQQNATFTSVMPILDDLLEVIRKRAGAEEVGGDSNEDIVSKVSGLVALSVCGMLCWGEKGDGTAKTRLTGIG